MLPLSVIHEFYDYGYWARDRQLEACRPLTEQQFLQPLGNSFSSVRDTLAHLVGSEWVWLQRWQGRSPARGDKDLHEFAAKNFPTLESVHDRWLTVERNVREHLKGLEEEQLGEALTYVNLAGETFSYPRWRTILHVANHATYHRGQITTLLRQLGAEPAAVDFLVAHDHNFGR